MNRKQLNNILVIMITLFSGATVTYMITDTGQTAVCRGGVWEGYNATHHVCTANNRLELCYSLSESGKTCHIGNILGIDQTCSEWRLCTPYRDFLYDRDCSFVTTTDLVSLCDFTASREYCVYNRRAYEVTCAE